MRLKTLGLAAGALLFAMPAKQAEAQVNMANVEGIAGLQESSYVVRPNVFYGLPLDIRGYSFLQFDQEGGYFGKTTLNRNVMQIGGVGLDAAVEATFNSKGNNSVSPGVRINIPVPEESPVKALNISWYPVTVDTRGESLDRNVIGYLARLQAGNTSLQAVGQVDVSNGQWVYGETNLEQRLFGNVSAALNVAHRNQGSVLPRNELRAILKYTF